MGFENLLDLYSKTDKKIHILIQIWINQLYDNKWGQFWGFLKNNGIHENLEENLEKDQNAKEIITFCEIYHFHKARENLRIFEKFGEIVFRVPFSKLLNLYSKTVKHILFLA